MNQEAASSSSASPTQTGAFILWDGTHYPSPPKSTKMEVPLSLTGQQFRERIAEELGYPKDSFDIKHKNSFIEAGEERTLEVWGAHKGLVSISRKPGTKDDDFKMKKIPQDNQIPTQSTSTAVVPYGPQNSNTNTNYSGNSGYSSGFQSSNYSNNWSYPTKPAGRSSSGFVGLSNQGATCYMNSLIQTLYMTPEFRAAVYNWSFDEKYKKSKEEKEQNGKGSNDSQAASSASSSSSSSSATANKDTDRAEKEKMSIPLQLQRLFARLQLSDVQAVKTKDLTKSFGWEDADAFTQHDVQELCRVLFDALEKNFKGTEQANIVNELYQGKMKDYVQCKECNNESARTDDFLDIPLVIKGFGETTAVSSVEEALQKFVTPEILEKDNQYNCEKCAKKVDAVKGLKFSSFPYLLALQLKRFDFDYTTMRRIKLNDRVTFPHYLDLNPFIFGEATANNNNNEEGSPKQADSEEVSEEDDITIEEYSDDEQVPNGHSNGSKRMKKVNGYNGPTNGHAAEQFDYESSPPVLPTPERPYIYELYSVLIHRGSTMGGHYYAYIKSFENKKWFDFNDSIVQDLNPNDIKKAFGGDDEPSYSGYSSMYRSSYKSTSNAYMLMYRRVDLEKNIVKVPEADVPKAAVDIIENEKQQLNDKIESQQKEREMVKLKIFYPTAASKEAAGKDISLHKGITFEEATKQAAELFGLKEKWEDMGLSGVRLRAYQPHNELPTTTYGGQEQKTLEDLSLYTMSQYSHKPMMLETREATGGPFVDYNMTDILFRVTKFDPLNNTFGAFISFYIPKSATFLAVKQAIETRLDIPVDKLRILKEGYTASVWANTIIDLVDLPDDYSVRGNKVSEPEKYYVEYSEDPLSEESTPAQAELIRLKNLIEVKFNIPDQEGKEETILVDKNMTLKDFRDKLSPIVGLSVDDFRIKRGMTPTTVYELVIDSDSLADNNVRDGATLIIEKGKPMKEGEVTYTFLFLELEKDQDNITELFDIIIDENAEVSDVRKVVAVKLREELQKRRNEKKPVINADQDTNGAEEVPVINPACIRLRDLSYGATSKKIGKALPNEGTLKKLLSTSRRIAVQILPEPEIATDDDLVLFVQLFKPSDYSLTRKEDFVIPGTATCDQFKAAVAKKYNIPEENVGATRVDSFYSFYDDPEPLEIPKLNWEKIQGTETLNDLYLRSGYLILVRDNTEPLKSLTKEEHDAIDKETRKRAAMQLQYSGFGSMSSGWNRKEKALKIHTSD